MEKQTVTEFLQEKFKETGYRTVTSWIKDTRCSMSLNTATAVLLRGTDKGFIAITNLACSLGCTKEEIQWIMREKGDKTLWRMITSDHLAKNEAKLVDLYRELAPDQQKLLISMASQMVPK